MNIVFASNRVQKLLTDDKALVRRFGDQQAERIVFRLGQLRSAPSLASIIQFGSVQCEELKGDRQGQLSVRLQGGQRLIFEPANDPLPIKPDGGLDWTRVTDIRIIEVVDYHG